MSSPVPPLTRPFDAALFDAPAADLFRAVRAHGIADHPVRDPPADARDRVSRLEARYRLVLPDDFRAYLLHAAPSGESMDDQGIAWWPIDRVRNIPDELDAGWEGHNFGLFCGEEDSYLVFADYLIWCYAWAICCSNGPNRGRVLLLGTPDRFVADSFRAFVALALADAPGIH